MRITKLVVISSLLVFGLSSAYAGVTYEKVDDKNGNIISTMKVSIDQLTTAKTQTEQRIQNEQNRLAEIIKTIDEMKKVGVE